MATACANVLRMDKIIMSKISFDYTSMGRRQLGRPLNR